jgi:N-methylhydantoinase A
MRDCREGFEELHERLFGYRLERPVEVVSLRQTMSGTARSIRLERSGVSEWSDEHPFDSGAPLSKTVRGPISIALPDATLHVAEGWTATSLPIGGWMLTRDGAR